MTEAFDVLIAGGGPAGMAIAIELAPALAVAVVDPGSSRRVHGETLAPGSRPLLTRLGVQETFLRDGHARCEGTMAAWGSAEVRFTDYLLHPERNGWRVDRDAFDRMLAAEAARRGATVVRESVHDVRRDSDRWLVTTDEQELSAQLIVDATGRHAAIARRLGARKLVSDQLVGIAGLLEPRSAIEHAAFPLIESRENGWIYSAVVPSGDIVVIAMTDSDIAHDLRGADSWQRWLANAPHTHRRTAGAKLRETIAVASASSHRLDPIAGDAWLAAGDAAAAFDPLSSQGITSSLRGGIDAASAIRRHFAGNTQAITEYAESIADNYDAYLTTRTRYYAMEQRWPSSPFWQRRIPQVAKLAPSFATYQP
jgi:flavin-dependent dehydrogenase